MAALIMGVVMGKRTSVSCDAHAHAQNHEAHVAYDVNDTLIDTVQFYAIHRYAMDA